MKCSWSRALAAFFLLSMRVLRALPVCCSSSAYSRSYAQSKTKELPGRVLVAVDRSDSMDVADPQRPPVDKLRLRPRPAPGPRHLQRRSTRLLDTRLYGARDRRNGSTTTRLATIRSAAANWSRRDANQHDRVCELADKVTRTQMARRILDDDGVRLLSRARRQA